MKQLAILTFVLCLLTDYPARAETSQSNQRLIVLTDIEADPDDTQSLVRLLLYSNSIDVEGLIATTSVWQKTRVAPESIRRVIGAYGEVQPNLCLHEAGYPDADSLLAVVSEGPTVYGMKGVGEGKDSPGSERIIELLEKDDLRPLWISVWGGVNTLAQALHKINTSKPKAEARSLISKLRVYAISDQDDSGIWIRNNFPELFYIVSPGDHYGSATWSAINTVVDGIDNHRISNSWLAQRIQQGHGPLGAAYPDVTWGMEGDTPAFLSLIPNGLNAPERPDWGGWGGRYELEKPAFDAARKGSSGVPHQPETREIWTDASDNYTPFVASEFGLAMQPGKDSFSGNKVTLWRWRNDFQNDFAARMNWCIATYEAANHPPVPLLSHSDDLTVESGGGLSLDGSGSVDPDGDSLSYQWFNYPEAGSLEDPISPPRNRPSVWLKMPKVEETETAHFILRVTDKGSPPLSRYKRVVVKIVPR
ncbi:MAG: DUF1593 domain-containing protein [Planctomycetales bacterium]|nr:DUF1593 domain-containing protein [Planctomycetales bacterium]